jgi:hypothetical protein
MEIKKDDVKRITRNLSLGFTVIGIYCLRLYSQWNHLFDLVCAIILFSIPIIYLTIVIRDRKL